MLDGSVHGLWARVHHTVFCYGGVIADKKLFLGCLSVHLIRPTK